MLSRFGWAAALTRDGIERTDILAAQTDESRRMIEVQVKGAQDGGSGRWSKWIVNAKAQQFARTDNEWFALVLLPMKGDLSAPRTFIVPRDHLSAATWIVHQEWLTDPEAPLGKRNTPLSYARVPAAVFEGYENRWDLLTGSAFEAPVLLGPQLRNWAQDQRIGLPPEHPWNENLPTW